MDGVGHILQRELRSAKGGLRPLPPSDVAGYAQHGVRLSLPRDEGRPGLHEHALPRLAPKPELRDRVQRSRLQQLGHQAASHGQLVIIHQRGQGQRGDVIALVPEKFEGRRVGVEEPPFEIVQVDEVQGVEKSPIALFGLSKRPVRRSGCR